MNTEIPNPVIISPYFVLEHDLEKLVHVLICKECLLVDISPFADDILRSQMVHLAFHDYVAKNTSSTVEDFPVFELLSYESDFADELSEEDEGAFWARSSRCEAWAQKLEHLDGKNFDLP